MYQINEYKNSAVAQSIANEKRDHKDGKIMTIVTGIALTFMFIAFRYAMNH